MLALLFLAVVGTGRERMSTELFTDRVGAASIEMRVVPSTYNEAERTFEIVFSTGAPVQLALRSLRRAPFARSVRRPA